jgi:hypothetical protein
LFIFTVIFTFLTVLSCDFFFPDQVIEETKDLRELTWELETTLTFNEGEEGQLRTVWGSSLNDIYVGGYSSEWTDPLYHFDGENWELIGLDHITRAGEYGGPIELYDMIGFAEDDIWIAGFQWSTRPENVPDYKRLLIHYDGRHWSWVDTPLVSGFFAIGANNRKKIWAGGTFSNLIRYNGESWALDSIPGVTDYDYNHYSELMNISGNSAGRVHALVIPFSVSSIYPSSAIYEYDNKKWKLINPDFHIYDYADLWTSPGGDLYVANVNNISVWDGNSWGILLEGHYYFNTITGNDDNNIIAGGWYNEPPYGAVLFHYNGVDWFEYDLPDNLEYIDKVWTDGEFAVALEASFQYTNVLIGK